jgi:hypothetical protein
MIRRRNFVFAHQKTDSGAGKSFIEQQFEYQHFLQHVAMYRGSRVSSPNKRRSSAMLRVSEFSETAQSFQTASSSSSFVISRCGFLSRKTSTRNAFGSTGNTSPHLTTQNSRSRTATSTSPSTSAPTEAIGRLGERRRAFRHAPSAASR